MSKIRLTSKQLDSAGVTGSQRKATSVSAPILAKTEISKIDIASTKAKRKINSIHDLDEYERTHLEENDYVIVDGDIHLYNNEQGDVMFINPSHSLIDLNLKEMSFKNGTKFVDWLDKYKHGDKMPKEVKEIFMRGACAELALGMQRVTKQENIMAITAVDYKGNGDLGHVVFKYGKDYYDVRGVISIEDYLSDYSDEYSYGIDEEEQEAVFLNLNSEAIKHLTAKEYFIYKSNKNDHKIIDKLAAKILNIK